MILFYNSVGINLLIFKIDTKFDFGIRLGTISLILFSTIWLTTALLRTRLGFRAWKLIHFLAFLIFPFVFFHAFQAGTVTSITGFRTVWIILGLYFLVLTIFRILFQFGLVREKYIVKEKIQEANNIVKLTLKAKGKGIGKIRPGQFGYISKAGFLREHHPFTLADFDSDKNEINFIFKKVGKWTRNPETLNIGDTVLIDGPYGIFLKDVYKYNTFVFYAGGIGITPSLSTIKKLRTEHKDIKIILFICTANENEIVYREELEKLAKQSNELFEIMYVISDSGKESQDFKSYIGKRIDSAIITECINS